MSMTLRWALALGMTLACSAAHAQTYPSRTITLVVPFAAGGPGDTVGRLLAEAMSKEQRIIVENIGGAGGNIGAARVAKAAADGYTLLFHQLGMAVSPSLYKKLDYDALSDFAYIGLVAYQPNVIVTRPAFPARTFPEFLAHLRANRESMSFSNTGKGGASHLCAILFMSMTGIEIKSVPYRATSLALNDILSGSVDLLCDSVATATPHIQAGTLKAFGVTSRTRSEVLPDVPTLDEQGLAGFDMVTWTALYAPKATPPEIVGRVVSMLQSAVTDPTFKASLTRIGSAAMPRERATPEALSSYLRQEMQRWSTILKEAKLSAE